MEAWKAPPSTSFPGPGPVVGAQLNTQHTNAKEWKSVLSLGETRRITQTKLSQATHFFCMRRYATDSQFKFINIKGVGGWNKWKMILEPPSSFHSFRMLFLFLLFALSVFLLYRFQRLQTLKTLTGHNVSLRLSEGSPAERAHQEVILPFMSMIDDAQLQDKGFEKIPPVLQEGEEKG